VPPIDPNTLPKDAAALRKIVVDLCEQLRHESSEKDKYRSLLRELLDGQRNRKSEQLSKEQLDCSKRSGRPASRKKKTPWTPSRTPQNKTSRRSRKTRNGAGGSRWQRI